MRHILRYLLGLLVILPFSLCAFSVEPHHKTAFIGAPGEVDLLPTYSYYMTDHFWNKRGKRLKAFNRFRKHSGLLYAEYAFNGCNSFTFNGGYSRICESLNGNSQGFEDSEVGWKHLFYENDSSAFTVEVIGIIPSGKKKSSFRYGQFGAEVNGLFSRYFNICDRWAWVDASLGYRYYSGFPSDQIRSSLAVGYFVTSQLQVIASMQLDYGLFNGVARRNRNHIAFNANYRLLSAKLEAAMRVTSWLTLTAGGYGHLWGQNVGTGGGVFGAVWLDF